MADDITAGGTPAPDSGVPAAPASTPASGTPAASTAPAAPAGSTANPGDDAERRFRGIQADLQKERQARQRYEQEVQRARQELEQERRRVQALAGVNPKSPEDANADLIRQRFAQMFPGLAKLDDAQIDKLLAVAGNADHLEQATLHHWQTHATRMLDSLTTSLSDALGGKLTDRQGNAIKRAYAQRAESDPEFLRRHEMGDPKLVEEFVKEWTEDWIEPARRHVTNEEVNRQRRVPDSRGRRDVTGGPPKAVDYKNPKAVEDALVESFKQHGGRFGEG